jgi:bifunctional DNA-binding transcriptional regulator/antitoxin component of YhaV-PrlF toxin-antitoxin module
MDTTRLSTKGQIVLPKTLRETRRLAARNRVPRRGDARGSAPAPTETRGRKHFVRSRRLSPVDGKAEDSRPNAWRYRAQNQKPA